jgi:hypothetical protein
LNQVVFPRRAGIRFRGRLQPEILRTIAQLRRTLKPEKLPD